MGLVGSCRDDCLRFWRKPEVLSIRIDWYWHVCAVAVFLPVRLGQSLNLVMEARVAVGDSPSNLRLPPVSMAELLSAASRVVGECSKSASIEFDLVGV